MNKLRIAEKVVQKIPPSFLKTERTNQTFGCPDCTDGCGIYFEMQQGTTVKRFRFEYNTDSKELKDFGEAIKQALAELNKKN